MPNNASRLHDILIPIAGGVLLLLLLRWHYLVFHTAVELFSAVVGILTFTIAANTFAASQDRFLYVFGAGSFWVGVNDLLHALTFHGVGILPGELGDLPTAF